MPNKHNADRRHHIPKMSFQVQNWAEYEAGLRRRGSLTLWIDEDALDQWLLVAGYPKAMLVNEGAGEKEVGFCRFGGRYSHKAFPMGFVREGKASVGTKKS